MIGKIVVLAAGGAGYVLGAKAGRGRYEQLRESYEKIKNDPRVQEKTQAAADLAREKAPLLKEKVADKAASATDAAKDTASSATSSTTGGTGGPTGTVGSVSTSTPTGATSESKAEGDLNPERLRAGEDTGPQGNLP